jgi:hypothetical protein
MKTFSQWELPNMWTFTIKMLHSKPWHQVSGWLDLFVLKETNFRAERNCDSLEGKIDLHKFDVHATLEDHNDCKQWLA